MFGGYVLASMGLAVLAAGGLMAFVTFHFARNHVRRSLAEKRLSEAVTRENYRHPVK